MSKHVDSRWITVPEIRARKGGEKIVCLTAYTAPMASEIRAQSQSPATTPVFGANRNRELTGTVSGN